MSNSLLSEHILKRNFISSLFIIISVVIGISEALLMLLLDALPQWGIVLTPIQGAALDAVFLACLSAPILWWLALGPLVKRIASEQVYAEEQARLNSELRTTQFNAILDTFTSAIITIDKTGIVQGFNKAAEQIFGFNTSEITGKSINCLIPSAVAAQHDGYLQRYLDTQNPTILGKRREVDGQRKNGDIFPALLLVNPMKIAGELFFFGVIDDISETKALQAQLVQAQKLEAIGQLASGVAHEINTPIQYIGDNLSALSDNFSDIIVYQQALQDLVNETLKPQLDALVDKYDLAFILEDSPKAIQQAREGVERVAEIVKAMKTFSHIEQGQNKQTIILHEALNSALTISRNSYKYIAEIETDFSSDVGAIECYANELNQVFLNLIINAAHAIEEKQAGMGLIRIVTRKLDDKVEVLIQDNGAGIPAEIQEKVFNLFFSTKAVGKGTGQGLSLSHSIVVEKHRGKLFFESAVGVGTTFHIQLPIKLEVQ
ncbi:MAG: PAS domain S-box protein [Methylobacter sp.]|nr:MAG: PAS domain S-box protein [Methylobacter sp.]